MGELNECNVWRPVNGLRAGREVTERLVNALLLTWERLLQPLKQGD
jgi:hypothetical protein